MMRFPLTIILLFALALTVPAAPTRQTAEEGLTAESTVSRVTVYRNGARVAREAEVSLSPGRNVILFTGLSPSLNSQTIQLSGAGDLLILSLTHRQDYLGENPQKRELQRLTARRDSLQRVIEDKETERSILDRELNILISNSNLKGNQQNLAAVELKQAMEFFHTKLTELETRKLELKRELEILREELRRIRSQISELDSNASRNRSVIEAVIQAESARKADFSLNYLVSRAGWYPSYDLRVDDIDGPVRLSYKANIYQSTGVEWDDVTLTVSSAIPERGGVLPQLQPWYLRFYSPQPAPRESGAPRMQMQDADVAQKSAAAQQREEESRQRPVPVREIRNQTSFSYRIDLPYSVTSGGNPLTVEIDRHDVPADYRYYTVPKLGNRAYLTARISEWDQYNLLPGDANLFLENTYVGKSAINPRSVGDTLSFSLGRDESIVIEREKLREFEEKNFFGNRVTESFAWQITVRNSKDQPARVEVRDQIPVSQHEDIEVNLTEDGGAEHNRQNGTLSWVLQLPPGEARTLSFEYEVEYPRGRQITF